MSAAPAASRQRGRAAAAGEHPPRRPRAARGRSLLTAAAMLATLAAGGAALAGCSAGVAATPAGSVFTVRHQVSLQRVRTEISALYSDHPGIAAFATQDVQYSASSRDVVLRECTAGGPGAASQDTETGQLVACAPLIFFLYSYGKQASVPAAVTVAGDLYWYAVAHITGPVSAKTSLDELLRSWKLPVPGLGPAQRRGAVAASVITAASDSTIRVTRQAAYFTGDTAGLEAYIGLPPAAAARVRSRWVEIKAGTSEYQSLAAENTIASLPSSILPSSADVTALRTATAGGRKEYFLDWKATASGSTATISVRLTLAATPQVLPTRSRW